MVRDGGCRGRDHAGARACRWTARGRAVATTTVADAIDLWSRLERSVQAYGAVPAPVHAKAESTPEERERKRRRRRRARRALDAVAVVVWTYVVTKLFVLDVERALLRAINEDWERLTDYRLFLFAALSVPLVLVLRWKLLVAVAYVAFFPITLVAWKLPWLLYRRKNWLYVVAVVNLGFQLFSGFVRRIIVLAIMILGSGAALLADSRAVLGLGILLLAGSLLAIVVRTLHVSLRPVEFLDAQAAAIEKVVNSGPVRDIGEAGEHLLARDVELYTKAEVDQFCQQLSLGIVANRGMYFWAYQLDRYRQSSAALLTLALQWVLLFVTAVWIYTCINVALLNGWPSEFAYSHGTPSFLRMMLFSASSLLFNAGAGVEAVGDAASLSRLTAGFTGFVVIGGVLLSLFSSYRLGKHSEASRRLVQTLKQRAAAQEGRLAQVFHVSMDEAIERLALLGNNLQVFVSAVVSSIPKGFMDDEPDTNGSGN